MNSSRRQFLKTAALGCAAISLTAAATVNAAKKRPNVLVIFADDLGYGDLGTFGHPTIKTPNLDRMAHEGQKWTSFYAAASVCTPSRAGLMTGRLPIRSGMCSDKSRVLFPNSLGGLPQEEVTIARAVKEVGYKTACIGKWHLGHLPQYLPTKHGFDYYFGIPYSNDMDQVKPLSRKGHMEPKVEHYNVPLMRNEEIFERPANQNTITKRYTEETINFIKENKDDPWFIYLAHSMVHIPLFASDEYRGKSLRGLFGDTIEEIDGGIGLILHALKELKIDDNTMIVFTSDNGPWLPYRQHGGSAGLLRDGKGTTWEGGMREPTVFYWPGKITPGPVAGMGSTLDLFATIANLAGAKLPTGTIMDSYDLGPTLFDGKPSPRNEMFYYRGRKIFAARKGAFKAHFTTMTAYQKNNNRVEHDPPILFNLEHDPGENYDISADHPEIIAEIQEMVKKHIEELVPGKDQLAARVQKKH